MKRTTTKKISNNNNVVKTSPPTTSSSSSSSLDRFNNDHKHLSNKTFPSFTGRQSSMLEFFPSKKQETQVNYVTEITEHDDGHGNKISTTTTTTTTTIATVVSQVIKSPSSQQQQQQQQQSIMNSNTSPSPSTNKVVVLPKSNNSSPSISPYHQNSNCNNTSPSPTGRQSQAGGFITPPSSQLPIYSPTPSPTNSQGGRDSSMVGKRKKGGSDIINNSQLVLINLIDDDNNNNEEETEMERFQKRVKNQSDKLSSDAHYHHVDYDDETPMATQPRSNPASQNSVCISVDSDNDDDDNGGRTKEQQEITMSQYADNDMNQTRYYVNDFTLVTETVLSRDSHLLSDTEVEAVNRFLYTLTSDSQHLFVRLYNRKGPWFQIQNILYSEVHNIDDCIDELIDCGLMERYESNTHDYRELTPLLPVDRLKRLLGASCPSDATKPKLIELVNKMDSTKGPTNSNGSPFFKNLNNFNKTKRAVEDSLGKCIQIKKDVVQLFRMIHHLFFFSWTTHNSTTMIVHNILGIRYPEYSICKEKNAIFKTRQDLIDYEQCRQLEERIEFIFENEEEESLSSILEICTEKLTPLIKLKYQYNFALKFSPGWVYTKVLSAGVAILERMKMYDDANYYYMFLLETPFCSGKRGDWWLRLVINSKHQNKKEDALVICQRALQDNFVKTGDRLSLEQQYMALSKTLKKDIKPGIVTLLNDLKQPNVITIHYEKVSLGISGVKSQFCLSDGSFGTVEDAALDYYKTEEGMKGIHCETGIFIEFFIFFFWDIIFCSDIPHVFQSPYQDAPLDFGSDEFYISRKDMITDKFNQLKHSTNQERRDILKTVWERNQNCNVRGINWERYNLYQLIELSDAFGGSLISYICQLLSEDFSSFSSGAPDLFLWKPNQNIDRDDDDDDDDDENDDNHNDHDTASYTIKFCEVKGEGDRLASHQKIWLASLLSFGLDVDNCLVKNK